MVVCQKIHEIKRLIKTTKSEGKSIGLVPTMGALHAGHLSLLNAARNSCDSVVCSIFVNPLQFNNKEDYHNYPVDFQEDLKILEKSGNDIVFMPEAGDMYPESHDIKLDFQFLEKTMEGKFRPGHFNGVALAIIKFLNIVNPDMIFLGQKDMQQAVIVRKLLSEMSFQTELKVLPTIRESDGLAFSSRNKRLTGAQRSVASNFYNALTLGKELLSKGESPSEVSNKVEVYISSIQGISLEYFEIVDSNTLESKTAVNNNEDISLCIAGYVGEIRLLDNIILND
ncbi:MAG: pantoate--beta-alanine ligase [Bacteroidetes bacterium]|nr:pantoate--beta-alanine ligase [Bacteroidota bacterium]MDA1122418.1 pantoate--beta-alanine ligase [Bacteroidota bacterium]